MTPWKIGPAKAACLLAQLVSEHPDHAVTVTSKAFGPVMGFMPDTPKGIVQYETIDENCFVITGART